MNDDHSNDSYESENSEAGRPSANIVDSWAHQIPVADLADPKKPNSKSPEPMSMGGYLAWATIITMTIGMFGLNSISKSSMATDATTEASSADLMPLQIQAKMLVGHSSLTKALTGNSDLEEASDRPDGEINPNGDFSLDEELPTGDETSTFAPNDSPLPNEDLDSGLSSSILEEAERQIDSGVGEDDKGLLDPGEQQFVTPLPTELDSGPYEQRLCYTILVNEIEGAVAAKEHLMKTDERAEAASVELTDEQQQLRSTIGKLLDNYQSGDKTNANISETDKDQLKDKLGWLGNLALVPAGTPDKSDRAALLSEAQTSMIVFFGAFGIGLVAIMAGVAVAICMVVFLVNGRIKPLFKQRATGHNIYAETFAIWMVIFFGGQIGVPLALMAIGITNQQILMSSTVVVFFGSLIALAWPSFRGSSFSQTCEDIGWKKSNPFVETAAGGASYLAVLPLMMASVILVTLLMRLTLPIPSPEVFTTGAGPSHPVQEYIADGGWFLIAFVFVSACIAAPIVEETMFRGVLYRHLRDVTGSSNRWLSVAFSGLLNSFLFAAIHPQGVFGIPMLMTLAIGFSLLREWRGSLFGAMFMHGLSNFLVVMISFALM